MIIPDVNLLLYAYNPQSEQHARSSSWWQKVMNGDELVGLPHEVIFGFLRITTNPRLGAAAIDFAAGESVVKGWIEWPQVRVLLPDPEHAARVLNLMRSAKGRGALISDAVLASYAIANRATLFSNDSDFARFPELVWNNPLTD